MNFNTISIYVLMLYGLMLSLFLTQPASAMLRRFTPTATPKISTTGLVVQKRTLLPGQENHPLWIKANREIEDFLKKNNIPAATSEYIKKEKEEILSGLIHRGMSRKLYELEPKTFEDFQNYEQSAYNESNQNYDQIAACCKRAYFSKDFTTFSKLYDEIAVMSENMHKASTHEEEIVEEEINNLLAKHNIDQKSIQILFNSQEDGSGLACTNGIELVLSPSFMSRNKHGQKAIIEHEISHIIIQDSALKRHYLKHLNPSQQQKYEILFEKRADIHSCIQSPENAYFFKKEIGYLSRYQEHYFRNQSLLKQFLFFYKYLEKNSDYAQEALDYHKKNAINNHENQTPIDPTELNKNSYANQKKVTALIGLTTTGAYLYKKHQENKDTVLRIPKNWHGLKPFSNTIWQTIEQKTNHRITRNTHTYSIVDCKTEWEITFENNY